MSRIWDSIVKCRICNSTQLSEILAVDDELETGEHELQIFKITINKIKTYEEDLIKCTR